MTDASPEFVYRVVSEGDLDFVRPLWEKLRPHHSRLPWRFAGEMHGGTFEPRKQEILAKAAAGKLRVELVSAGDNLADIAYCVSTVTADGRGEVDSVFVEEHLRGRGIGSELVRRALAWLDSMDASSKFVSVAHGNAEAMALYQRLGFHPRTILLQRIEDGTV